MEGILNARYEDFNTWAKVDAWDAHLEVARHFEHSVLAGLLSVWRTGALNNVPPRRSEMSARLLKPFLRDIAIFERVTSEPLTYRVRVMGTRVGSVIGDMQGHLLQSLVPIRLLPRWHRSLELTLSDVLPIRVVCNRVDYRDLHHLRAELLLAPLLDESDMASAVLIGAHFAAARSADVAAA